MSENLYDQLNIPPEVRKFLKNTRTIILIVVVVVLLISSVFTVGTEEEGVITRFGKYNRTVESGLNFKIPFTEKVYKVPVERQQKLEFGFRTLSAGVNSEFERTEQTFDESLMLTGDLNLAEVEWVIQYRVDDAYNYLFKVRHIERTLRDISEAVMRQIAGNRTINQVLMEDRIEMKNEMKEVIQKVCKDYSMGIKIEQILLQGVNAPAQVRDAFNRVNEAKTEKQTLINQAEEEYNKIIPEAEGQAKAMIAEANGYKIKRINTAQGDSARFASVYKEYIKAPEVTKRRLYLETMSKVIPKAGNIIINDQKGNNLLPLLNMNLNKKNIQSEN